MNFFAVGSLSLSLKRSLRPSILAVLDQCLFSGTNFLTAILIGRIAGEAELGIYALCFSLTMICIATQRALLISPFVVVSATLELSRFREMRATMLIASAALALTLALISMVSFAIVSPITAIAVVLILPAGLFRDFHRRLSIAQLQLVPAFRFDLAIAVCQISTLGYFAWFGMLSATSALFICASIWTMISVITFFLTREDYLFDRSRFRNNLAMLWPIGRWVGLSQMVSTAQAFALPWVLAIAGSMKLAGLYAACWTIVQVTSPVIEGLGNLLSPALARSAREESLDALKHRALMATTVFFLLMISLVISISIFGRHVLTLFYGESYVDGYHVLVLLTLAATVLNIEVPATKALTQLGKANWNFVVASISLVTTISVAAVSLSLFGSNGAAWGLLIGAILSAAIRWFLFHRRCQQLTSIQDEFE